MWKLYEILKPSINNSQEFLVDEVLNMMDKISKQDFVLSIQMMYGDTVSLDQNPVQLVTMFVSGLKRNEIFFFDSIIKGLVNGSSTRG